MKRIWDRETGYQPYDPDRLYRSVPGMGMLREIKQGYRGHPINPENPLFNEELADLHSYGVAGQNYYSRPNAATGEPLPDSRKPLMVRRTLAEKLGDINHTLTDPIFTEFFGGEVELFVEDAFRSPGEQQRLYDEVFPGLIVRNNPEATPEERREIRNRMIAAPSWDPLHPSPHATGGAVDVYLRFKEPGPHYVPGAEVPMGHTDGDTSERVMPDYFELTYSHRLNKADRIAKANRRAFYAIMTGAVFGTDTGLQVNPTEWWHWSYGDQMWARLRHEPAALYGMAAEA